MNGSFRTFLSFYQKKHVWLAELKMVVFRLELGLQIFENEMQREGFVLSLDGGFQDYLLLRLSSFLEAHRSLFLILQQTSEIRVYWVENVKS